MPDDTRIPVTIRRARPSDAATLAHMRYRFRAELGPADESEAAFLERCVPWMAERLGAGSAWRCWVAERDGRIEGHIWVGLLEKIPNPVAEAESHAYISNLYVREEERGQGVGGRLLGAALRWCARRDVHAVILWPSERSRTLYERHGFDVRPDLMERILRGPGASGAHGNDRGVR